MGEGKNKIRIQQLEKIIQSMQKDTINMIKAFQNAFTVLRGKTIEIITAVGKHHPEVLELLQVQPEEGSNESDNGDEQPRILSMPGRGADRGDSGESQLSEDQTSS